MPCASTFLTSDWEIPNSLAIADGLAPALKAARTAFSLPVVNEPPPYSAASWRRCGFALATGFSFAGLGGRRPFAPRCSASEPLREDAFETHLAQPPLTSGGHFVLFEGGVQGPYSSDGHAPSPTYIFHFERRRTAARQGVHNHSPICRSPAHSYALT